VAPGGPLPRVLGVEAAGSADGARVLVTGAGLALTRDGVWAQRAVVPRAAVLPVPEGVGLRKAACVAIAGVTAHTCLVDLAQVRPGERVLVLGASGGVGLAAASLAAGYGAVVLAHTGSPDKADALRSLGASEVVDAGPERLAEAVRGLRPDVVVDALGGAVTAAVLSALGPFARHVLFGTTTGPRAEIELQVVYRKDMRLLGYSVLSTPDLQRRESAARTLRALADGRMRLPVSRVLPLDEGAVVFDALADRTRVGKLVLDLAPAL